MSEKRPLHIALPIYGHVEPGFLRSWTKLIFLLQREGIPAQMSDLPGESLVTRARNRMVAEFMKTNAETFLFLDVDLEFDPATIVRMYRSGLDVVAAPYPVKDLKQRLVCNVSKDAEQRDGFVKGYDLPTGCLMIRRWVFEKLRPMVPMVKDDMLGATFGEQYSCFFEDGPEDGQRCDSRFLSEDYWASRVFQLAGIDTWLDTRATMTHWGKFPFKAPSLEEQWAADAKKSEKKGA